MSIGVGQPAADPFLAFIRRIFWPEQLPALNDGILATLWTITHAIHALPGGVAGPVQVVTLSQNDEGWKARELSDSELGEHQQMIAEMEDWMREVVKGTFTKEPTSPMPGTE